MITRLDRHKEHRKKLCNKNLLSCGLKKKEIDPLHSDSKFEVISSNTYIKPVTQGKNQLIIEFLFIR